WPPIKRSTSISNMTRGPRRWLGGLCASPEENRYKYDGGQDHRRRRELRLAKTGKDGGVRAQVAEREAARGVDPEVHQAKDPMRPIASPSIAAGPLASRIFQNEYFARRDQMKTPAMAPKSPPHWLMPPSVSANTRRSCPLAKSRKFSQT